MVGTLDNVHVGDNLVDLAVVVEDLVVDLVVYNRHLVVAGLEHSLVVEEEHFPVVVDQVVLFAEVLAVHQIMAYAAVVVDNFALVVVVHLQFVEVPWHLVAELNIQIFNL